MQVDSPTQLRHPTSQSIQSSSDSSQTEDGGVLARLKLHNSRFWSRQIVVVTGQASCRDHFANERTFLGYLRTSSAFATLGVASVQLFILGENVPHFRAQYGKVLALACEAVAVFVALAGGWRFWRHQNAMLRGKAQVGGWELYTIGCCGISIAILALILVLLAGCD